MKLISEKILLTYLFWNCRQGCIWTFFRWTCFSSSKKFRFSFVRTCGMLMSLQFWKYRTSIVSPDSHKMNHTRTKYNDWLKTEKTINKNKYVFIRKRSWLLTSWSFIVLHDISLNKFNREIIENTNAEEEAATESAENNFGHGRCSSGSIDE